jgi:hypothetical protein
MKMRRNQVDHDFAAKNPRARRDRQRENSALLFFHGVRWQVAGQGD